MRGRVLLPAFALLLGACAGTTTATTSVEPTTTTSPAPPTTVMPTTTSSTMPPTTTTTSFPYPIRAGYTVETIVTELDAAAGGLSVDTDGFLYSADFGEPGRRATRVYRISPEGDVDVFADDSRIFTASGNEFGPDGTLYQSSFRSSQVFAIDPDGNATPFDGRFSGPVGLAYAGDGRIFVAECTLGRIRVINPDGTNETWASDDRFQCPNGLTLDPDENLYMADFGSGDVFKISPEAEVSLLATLPGGNNGHLEYHEGELIVAARGAHQIYAVGLDGNIELIAGSGETGLSDGPGPEADIGLPNAVAIGRDGTIYVNHANNDGQSNAPTGIRAIRPPG